jgi:hypothetical protein
VNNPTQSLIQQIIEGFPKFCDYERKNKNAKLEPLVRALSPDNAVEFGKRAIEAFYEGSPDNPDEAADWLCLLAHLHPQSLRDLDAEIFDLELHRDDPILLQLSSMDIVEQIIDDMEDLDDDDVFADLETLVWICKGDSEAIEHYRTLYVNPPKSLINLVGGINKYTGGTMTPSDYLESMTRQAGWEFISENEIRNLHYPVLRRLLASHTPVAPIAVAQPTNLTCPWTGYRLPILLQLNLKHPDLAFLKINGKELNFPAHPQAAACGDFFTKSSRKGDFFVHPVSLGEEVRSQIFDPERFGLDNEWVFPKMRYTLAAPCPAIESAHFDMPVTYSQIGGMPTWEQDARYPVCPDCRRTMLFVAQLHASELEEHGTGTFYFHYCVDCEVACTRYDCT